MSKQGETLSASAALGWSTRQLEGELYCNSFEVHLAGGGGLELEAETSGTSMKSKNQVFFLPLPAKSMQVKRFPSVCFWLEEM